MIFCPKCGTVLDEDDRFCTECGTDISIRPREGKSDNDIAETRFVPSETSLNFGHGTISGKNSWDSYPGMREGTDPFANNGPAGFQPIQDNSSGQAPRTGTVYAPFGYPNGNTDQFDNLEQAPQKESKNTTIIIVAAIAAIILVAGLAAFFLLGKDNNTSRSEEATPVPSSETTQPEKEAEPDPEPEPVAEEGVKHLTVVGADGTTRSAEIHCQGNTDRVLPEGNTAYYSANDLASLSDAERCIAWNEIIASSNGYCFKNSGLREYFDDCSWYYPVSGASPAGNLTDAGKHNVELLKSMTDSWWLDLATY